VTLNEHPIPGRFTVHDFDEVSALVLDAWTSGADLDWSVPAGTLDWTCLHTADHVIDCVFSYALFLASRRQDAYPNFGELHALPAAMPRDLVDGLRAVTTMLSAVITTAPPDTTAVIWRRPAVQTGTPGDFAARGGLELILHGHDVCAGLGVALDPPGDLCRRLFDHTAPWPRQAAIVRTDDPWADLRERSGRPSGGR
jgi:hypothetical protein